MVVFRTLLGIIALIIIIFARLLYELRRFLAIIVIALLLLFLAFSCNTKKKITKEATKTQTESTTTISTNQSSQDNGITIRDTRTIGRILDENRIVFDSIATVTISPQGTITAKGKNPVIHRSKRSEILTDSKVLVDTTRSTALSTDLQEDQTQTIDSTVIHKDVKTRPAFLSIVIVLALAGLLLFIIIGLKNSSFFR